MCLIDKGRATMGQGRRGLDMFREHAAPVIMRLAQVDGRQIVQMIEQQEPVNASALFAAH
jgi:hypothetical protein